MDKISIKGQRQLSGEVKISGAKKCMLNPNASFNIVTGNFGIDKRSKSF